MIPPVTEFQLLANYPIFRLSDILDPKDIRKLDPFSIYALSASIEAVSMAGLDLDNINLDRAGVTIGTGVGGIQTLEEQHSIIEKKVQGEYLLNLYQK